MSSNGEWDVVKGFIWGAILIFTIAFWSGVFLLVDWIW